MARSARSRQGSFEFTSWGGARAGAGRKRSAPRPRVAHTKREPLAARYPVHVTLRLAPGPPSLRRERTHRALLRALALASEKAGFRCVHYSAQSNHVHLVCEAHGKEALARGLQGLCVRLARGLTRLWSRAGRVFDDRYHARILKGPREVRNALGYVLRNARHHGLQLAADLDPFSSSAWFDGWRRCEHAVEALLPTARTWLLAVGWRRHGLLERDDFPRVTFQGR